MLNLAEYLNRDKIFYVILFSDSKYYTKDNTIIKTWRKMGNKNKDFFAAASVDCFLEKEICINVFDY